jgi:hypothetical protein
MQAFLVLSPSKGEDRAIPASGVVLIFRQAQDEEGWSGAIPLLPHRAARGMTL